MAMDDGIREYVAGLPDASGTFTGTYDADVLDELLGAVPELMPIEVDTSDSPNPVTGFLAEVTVTIGERTWTLPVDHVDLLGGNRARVWVRRPQPQGAE